MTTITVSSLELIQKKGQSIQLLVESPTKLRAHLHVLKLVLQKQKQVKSFFNLCFRAES